MIQLRKSWPVGIGLQALSHFFRNVDDDDYDIIGENLASWNRSSGLVSFLQEC